MRGPFVSQNATTPMDPTTRPTYQPPLQGARGGVWQFSSKATETLEHPSTKTVPLLPSSTPWRGGGGAMKEQ